MRQVGPGRLGPTLHLPTLATAVAVPAQRWFAIVVSLVFGAVSCVLLPMAAQPAPPMPGFIAVYQTALIVVYAITTYLFFAQFRRTRSLPLLLLGAGSLYVTGAVFIQFLAFPNVLVRGALVGSGPDTLIWLWTFWHLGPPAFALAYVVAEARGGGRLVPADRTALIGGIALVATLAMIGLVALLSTTYVHLLPKSVDGDDYSLMVWNGTGSGTQVLTLIALVALCVRTKLRTVLQLWLAVSLLLLIFDNFVTMAGAARGTTGWFAGRLLALGAGITVLAVYLREVDFLYGRAEQAARERDIQARDLRVARENLEVALDAAEMGSWEYSQDSGASRRDRRHDALFGYRDLSTEWTEELFLQHVVPEDRESVRAAFEAAARVGMLVVACRIRRADDGAVRWIELRGKAHRGPDGRSNSIAGVILDTTERRESEARLGQAQKMEALGQLTGGVAHDFNNLLTIVIGNLDMIARKPDDPDRIERLARSGLEAARRGARVTESLLTFSRRQALRLETVNPNRLLRDFEALIRRAVGESIEVRLELDAELDPVRLDRGQFENAILNLSVNARDAMAGHGMLTLKTSNVRLLPDDVSDRPDLGPGDFVRVAISDTGTGMDQATAARAFEPFFTTKDVGRGTGLGLSQVHGFVRGAGGLARIRTVPGEGTTVELFLPHSTDAAEEERLGGDVPLRRAAAGEVVLVVEDEPGVLEVAVESLSELGYVTLTASDAAEALDRIRGGERIDVMFSDIVMPGGMNGVQLAVEGRRIRPDLKVLLTSGYTDTALDNHVVPDDLPLLGKPYLREELAAKLRLVAGGR